jgi:glutathione synthase
MRIAVIMDPIESILVDRDTSFALMLAAQTRGHEVFYVAPHDLWYDGGQLRALAHPVSLQRAEPPEHAHLGAAQDIDVKSLDVALVRTDPPFDQAYLQTTQLLELVRNEVFLMNDPRGLRDANEKLFALHVGDLMPRTTVTASSTHIERFVEDLGGRAVIKPLNGAGGRGVMILDRSDLNFHVIIEMATAEGSLPVMVQEYLSAVRQGDKRILLLDGEPLGAILRVPRADEARSNLHVGGKAEPAELTLDDERIVRQLAPLLRAMGLFFVGIDVIGGKLTEVNVTSPTGIQEMSRFMGIDLAAAMIAWLERRVSRKGAALTEPASQHDLVMD